MTSRRTEEQLSALRDDMLKGCTGAMPMPTKPFTMPPIKPTTKPYFPNGKPTRPTKPMNSGKGFKRLSMVGTINSELGI